MKKTIIIYALFLISGVMLYSQNSDKIKYTGGEIYRITENQATGKETSNIPLGKVLSIEYDTFFKRITCLFEVSKGVTGFSLEYVRDVKNGSIDMMLMYDRANNERYYVINHLDVLGTMWLTLERISNGEMTSLFFKNVKRE